MNHSALHQARERTNAPADKQEQDTTRSTLLLSLADPSAQTKNLFCTLGIWCQILVPLMHMNANALEGLAVTGTIGK